jgi:hypothetical protein
MTVQASVDVNPFRPGFLADPWQAYDRMRAAGPVVWNADLKFWFVTARAEAVSLLRDDGFSSGGVRENLRRLADRSGRSFAQLLRVLDALPFFRNPPEHALLRRATVAAFADRPIAAYAGQIRELVDRLLRPARRDGGFDAVRDFADRLPALFVARLLGIPEAELAGVQRCDVVLRGMNRLLRFDEYESIDEAARAGIAYFSATVAARRRSPGDDGISRMMAAEHQGRRLSDEEIAHLCIALYLVSVETTSTLIGSAIRTLADLPEQQSALRAQPALLKPAVEELLRYETPVQNVHRVAAAARQLGGQQIRAGDKVVVVLAAANRDADAWPAPERLDFSRSGPPHLAFADGPHQCVGAALARLEAQVALGAWLELPASRRASPRDLWWDLDWLRRLREFPVELH